MDIVTLQPLFQNDQKYIGIYFENKSKLNGAIRKYAGAKWSITNKCWFVPLTQKHYSLLSKALYGKATLQTTALKEYLISRQQNNALLTTTNITKPFISNQTNKIASPQIRATNILTKISKENQEALEKFIQQLHLKAYSQSTIRTYRNELMQLIQWVKDRPVNTLTTEDLKRYMVHILKVEKLTENTAHSRLNAFKFYFEQVLGKGKFFYEIPRPKKKIQLPTVLNKDEIASIIKSLQNRKHKAMIMLAYSSGLRVSEVVNLRTSSIDSKRMVILIKEAKGKKDRIVSLSPVLLTMLREYAKEYKPAKNGFLFEGSIKGTPYSTRSLQEVMQMAKTKAGVIKPGSIHTLSHSYATHLIDSGTDVTLIQKILGHNDLKTTLRYLHTSNRDLLKIISPLDDLNLT